MIPWLYRPGRPTPDDCVDDLGDSRRTRCPSPEELPLWFFLDAFDPEAFTDRSEQGVQSSTASHVWRRVLGRDRSPL